MWSQLLTLFFKINFSQSAYLALCPFLPILSSWYGYNLRVVTIKGWSQLQEILGIWKSQNEKETRDYKTLWRGTMMSPSLSIIKLKSCFSLKLQFKVMIQSPDLEVMSTLIWNIVTVLEKWKSHIPTCNRSELVFSISGTKMQSILINLCPSWI